MLHQIIFTLSMALLLLAMYINQRKGSTWLVWGIVNVSFISSDMNSNHIGIQEILGAILSPLSTAWVIIIPEHWKWIKDLRQNGGIFIILIPYIASLLLIFLAKFIESQQPHISIFIIALTIIFNRSFFYAYIFYNDENEKKIKKKLQDISHKLKWTPVKIVKPINSLS